MKLYKSDGVDIDAGDAFSKYCNLLNQTTYGISRYVKVYDFSRGNFRGPKGFTFVNLPKGCINTGAADGIGTKVVIIVAAGNIRTSASNLIAMTAMDVTRWGGLPLVFMNIFDPSTLGEVDSETFHQCRDVMNGLHEIAHKHDYVLFTGETAELGPCVDSENSDAKLKFNWSGVMIGVYHPKKMILGETLKPGQVIIALRDNFRSNGFSSARKALAVKYGEKWWDNPDAYEDIHACASPSVQYDRMLNMAHGWFSDKPFEPLFKMHSIVHLSGGAFKSKFAGDVLKPLGLSAELLDLFEPSEIMQKCAEWRGMDAHEFYTTFNGGQGALVVVGKESADDFIEFAGRFGVEAKKSGKIIKKREYTVSINSKYGNGETVCY